MDTLIKPKKYPRVGKIKIKGFNQEILIHSLKHSEEDDISRSYIGYALHYVKDIFGFNSGINLSGIQSIIEHRTCRQFGEVLLTRIANPDNGTTGNKIVEYIDNDKSPVFGV